MTIDGVIVDAPKRKEVLKLKGATAYFSCDVCLEKATNVDAETGLDWEVGAGRGTTKRIYPWKALEPPAERRTGEFLLKMGKLWERSSPKERKQLEADFKGVQGLSLLHLLKGSPDVVKLCPPEYMHFLCMGVCKDLLQMSLDVTGAKKYAKKKNR